MMKFFNIFLICIIGSILFFGMVMKPYIPFEDITRDCLVCGNNGQPNQLILGNFNLTNGAGDILDTDNCNDDGPIFLTFEYSAQSNLSNVFFVTDLVVSSNIGDDEFTVPLDFFFGDLPRTGNNSGTESIEIELPEGYNCQSQSLQLTDIKVHWLSGNRDPSCENYNNGQCRSYTDPRNITVDGFVFDFDYVIGCFEEDGSTVVTYFITALAGGDGNYDINWTINKNGTEVPFEDQFIVPVVLESDSDEVSASLIVTYGDGETMDVPPGPITALIPEIFDIPDSDFGDNDENEVPFPNGFITIDIAPEEIDDYLFVWLDDDGNLLEPADPTSLTELEAGVYLLTLIDVNTGLCRILPFTLNIIEQPVLYAALSIEYLEASASVNFHWSTTKEWEASHFEIERSTQGLQFEKIGQVQASGWSDRLTAYTFEDLYLPLRGGNLLYRLKQVDLNGDFQYSEVLSVRIPGVEFTSGVWRAFPNPINSNLLQIRLMETSQYNGEPLSFKIIHPTAQSELVHVASESEMNELLQQMVARIPKGVFVVEIQWGQKVEHIKVLRQ